MERWCKKCKTWEKADEGCGSSGFNKALRMSMLNSHLYAQADRVTKEHTDQAHFVKQAKREQRRVAGS